MLIEHCVHSHWDEHGVHNYWEHAVSTVLCNPGEDSPTLRPTSGLIFKCCHVLVFKWPAIELLQYPTITYHALITKQHWFKFLIYWLNARRSVSLSGRVKVWIQRGELKPPTQTCLGQPSSLESRLLTRFFSHKKNYDDWYALVPEAPWGWNVGRGWGAFLEGGRCLKHSTGSCG